MKNQRSDARRPYIRPMAGWWRKNPFFLRYMLREGTALGVAGYGFVLLAGLVCLGRGEAAYNGWLQALASPLSIVLHLIMLALMIYHSWSWFDIMPKTMPPLYIGGKRVAGKVITRTGIAAAIESTLVLWLIVWSIQP